MYIPNIQSVLASALALSTLGGKHKDSSNVAKGEVLDFCNKECLDSDGGVHCTKPFLVTKDKVYTFEWKTKGNVLTHTTLELRDVKSKAEKPHYYRDTNGDWTSDFTGLVYLDFVPRTGCDNEVEYRVTLKKDEKLVDEADE